MTKSNNWIEQKERTNKFWLNIILFLALRLPRGVVRLFLYPIVFFFMLVSREQKSASYYYLNKILGRKANYFNVFKHFHYFATTILDRVYFLTNRVEGFDIYIENLDELKKSLAVHPGQLFISAHFGSLDAVRATSVKHFPIPLKAVLKVDHNQTLVKLLNELNHDLSEMLIPYKGLQTIFDIHSTIEEGVSVALLQDRQVGEEATVEVEFLGDKIQIPISAFKLSQRFNIPITVFFGRYEGKNRYVMTSETLAITSDMTFTDMAQIFMDKVAEQCHKAPYNWFNFYKYWL